MSYHHNFLFVLTTFDRQGLVFLHEHGVAHRYVCYLSRDVYLSFNIVLPVIVLRRIL